MIREPLRPEERISRHAICRTEVAAAGVIPLVESDGLAAERKSAVRFFKNLTPGPLGANASQWQALDHAVQYGFDGISPSEDECEDKSAAEIGEWVAAMKEKGIRYGARGLPVEFRRGEDPFHKDLALLPMRASLMKQLGVHRDLRAQSCAGRRTR